MKITNQFFGFMLGCSSLFFLNSCGTDNTTTQSSDVIESDTGMASFYGPGLEGKTTASGDVFHSEELSAAHPSYPMGTTLRVTNLENSESVEVIVNDRGPTAANRRENVIIDLSKGAAEELDMLGDGRVEVAVDVLDWGEEEDETASNPQ